MTDKKTTFESLFKLKNVVLAFVEEVDEGIRDPLDLIALAKVFEEYSTICNKVKDQALEELLKLNTREDAPTRLGYSFKVKNTTRYNYKAVAAWQKVKDSMAKYNAVMKDIEKTAQALAKGEQTSKQYVNELTGEVVEITPAIASTTQSIILKKA